MRRSLGLSPVFCAPVTLITSSEDVTNAEA
jgi:hypothetical protein